MFTTIAITRKLVLITLLPITMILLMALASAYRLNNIEHHVASIKDQDIPLTELLSRVTAYQLEQEVNFEKVLRYTNHHK